MSRGIRLLAPVVTAAVVLALTTSPAAADPGHDVPNQAVITIRGDGSGHGRGLSQYGAYSAARKGKGYRTIVGFYYPRTRWRKVGGTIEVLVSRDNDGDTVVGEVRGLKVRDVDRGRTVAANAAGATRWRIQDDGTGASQVSWFDGSWHDWRTFDGAASFTAGDRVLTLHSPNGRVRYHGALRSALDDHGDRVTVNDVAVEKYVRGVVPAEMQAGWPQQALRSQAVASRTYGVWRRNHPLDVAYDICDTALCQVYRGRSAEAKASNTAVRMTGKQVLTYRRKPIFAEFSASNGGYTVRGGKPYLPAKRDRFEGTSSDYYGWKVEVTAAEMEAEYHYDDLDFIRVVERDGRGRRGGRVERVRVTAGSGFTDTVTGDDFRVDWGLPSSLFEITRVR
jgi:peptidoglycan hydrolase-like amidase